MAYNAGVYGRCARARISVSRLVVAAMLDFENLRELGKGGGDEDGEKRPPLPLPLPIFSFALMSTSLFTLSTLPNLPMLLTSKMAANALNQNNAPTLQATIIMSLPIAESVILRDVKFHFRRSSENQNILRETFKNC